MEEDKEFISVEKVMSVYRERAEYHGDENAVLDGSLTPKVVHTNFIFSFLTRRFMMDYLKPMKNEIILDYGCGMGRMSFTVAKYAAKVYGVDISPELIAMAKKELMKSNIPNIEFQLLDPHSFHLPEIKIDQIFMIGTITHISDQMLDKILPQFYSRLKKGGKIVMLEYLNKEQTRYANNDAVFRSIDHLQRIFEKHDFKLKMIKPVIRMPSYAIHLWKKLNSSFTFLLPLFYQIEKATINRKPQFIDYHYYISVFTKKEDK